MSQHNRVVLEVAPKRSFVSAIDWPGWVRSRKTPDAAMQALIDYLPRYQVVAERAGVAGVADAAATFQVVDERTGNGSTEFGAIGQVHDVERGYLTNEECERHLALLATSWDVFDDVVGRVSPQLRKGPRGGGRNRDQIVEHVLEAERNYARSIGVRANAIMYDDTPALRQFRDLVIARIREVNRDRIETRWPIAYFMRRAAWHVLDHAWEMEDKDLTGKEDS